MIASQPEVLIVGAGPTGLFTALELKRYGIHPRIVDRAFGLGSTSRALNINSRSLELLEPCGVAQKLLTCGNQLRRTYLVENGSTSITLHIEALQHRYPFTLIVPQTVTEMLLMDAVSQFGIAIEWETELMELNFAGDIATAVLATADKVEYVTPDYLIAADGGRSTVRHLADLDMMDELDPMVFALADIRYRMPRDPSSAIVELLPGGAVASFAMDACTIRHTATSDNAISLMRQRRTGGEVLWTHEYHVKMGYARQMSRGNVYLAGDAAHVISPVGARGINLGLEDAAWLAWLIGRGEAHERYSKERLPVARRVTNFTRRQTYQLFEASGPLQKLIRRYLAAPLLALPIIEQAAIRGLAGLDTPDPPWLSKADF